MTMIDLEIISKEEKYWDTIKELRTSNFSRNLPFLILSEKLPDGQVYREYPDGHIELQEVSSKGPKYNYTVLNVLTGEEADSVRREYGLF